MKWARERLRWMLPSGWLWEGDGTLALKRQNAKLARERESFSSAADATGSGKYVRHRLWKNLSPSFPNSQTAKANDSADTLVLNSPPFQIPLSLLRRWDP